MRPLRVMLITVTLGCLVCACGYRFGGVDQEPLSIAVSMYGNSTREPLLEKELTNLLISELERSPSFIPQEVDTPSRLSLEGAVTGYTSSAVAYDADDQIVRYLVRISAVSTLREEPSGRVVWRGVSDAAQEYAADPDKALQRQREEQARLQALARLAEEITQRLGQRF